MNNPNDIKDYKNVWSAFTKEFGHTANIHDGLKTLGTIIYGDDGYENGPIYPLRDVLKELKTRHEDKEGYEWLKNYLNKSKSSSREEPKKRGRPAKSQPSENSETIDRNVAAHMRMNKDKEYTEAINSLRYSDKISAKQMSSMLGDLEDNKYAKLDKALAKYNVTVEPISLRAPSPEPKKKRGRPPKHVDTSKIKSLIHEIEEHSKRNPHKLSHPQALPEFPKASKLSYGNMDKQNAYINKLNVASLLKKIDEHKKHNPVTLANISEFPKAKRSEISTLKKTIKSKAKRMMSDIEHSDLMKYISQF